MTSLNLITGEPFTIIAPRNSAGTRDDSVLTQPDLVRQILLDHVVLGTKIDITNTTTFNTLGGKAVHVRNKDGKLHANDALIVEPRIEVPNGVVIVVDNYLFPEEKLLRKNHEGNHTRSNDAPGMLTVITVTDDAGNKTTNNATFVENIMQVLSYLKSGVRVFQHFLSRSNVSQLLKEGKNEEIVPFDTLTTQYCCINMYKLTFQAFAFGKINFRSSSLKFSSFSSELTLFQFFVEIRWKIAENFCKIEPKLAML